MVSQAFSVLVVTGETSGEQHAAGLIHQVKRQNPDWEIKWFGSGGSEMGIAGVELLMDVSSLAAVGPWEALSHMGNYWSLYQQIISEVRRRRPQMAILVDFPDFNLKLARRLKKMKVPVCYFIGPQVWAWRPRRIEQIKRWVDLMLVIFPFEQAYYRQKGVNAHYVGNPSIHLRRLVKSINGGNDVPPASSPPSLVALLPGSRRKEVEKILPIQLDAAAWIARRHSTRFVVSKAPSISVAQLEDIYQVWQERNNLPLNMEIGTDESSLLLSQSRCAIVKSGTSTLEATILRVPFAMVYRLSSPSWYLARPFVRGNTYCLANLIAGERIVPEFVQHQATGENIGSYLLELLENPHKREKVKVGLEYVSNKLGDKNAYQESARHVGKLLF
ncbi:MAG: lipid-A-disaccharide synthase [Acidobacteriota bacterium]|nr:lipid-A-disaccharide synthase [Acidobacteriota bacterium]